MTREEEIKIAKEIVLPFTLYWPRDVSKMLRESICKYLGIMRHMTINRETVVWLTGEQRMKVMKVEEQGFVKVRNKANKTA